MGNFQDWLCLNIALIESFHFCSTKNISFPFQAIDYISILVCDYVVMTMASVYFGVGVKVELYLISRCNRQTHFPPTPKLYFGYRSPNCMQGVSHEIMHAKPYHRRCKYGYGLAATSTNWKKHRWDYTNIFNKYNLHLTHTSVY